MSLNRCPKKGTLHSAHPIRLYFAGMGGVVSTTCPGESLTCPMCEQEGHSIQNCPTVTVIQESERAAEEAAS